METPAATVDVDAVVIIIMYHRIDGVMCAENGY